MHSSFDAWRDGLRSHRGSRGEAAPHFYFIDVSLGEIADDGERNSFNVVPTTLTLDPATVDPLRAVARKLQLESPALKQLEADLGK